ncbi:MAG: Smr/MutS family protein [bacterium]|nr:Smr/MutS family protein [bacterium]
MFIYNNTPKLDLHGEIVSMVEVLVNDFIEENILLENKYVLIIHGKSTNILTKEVHRVLKNNKSVIDFYLDNWNLGQTIVELK